MSTETTQYSPENVTSQEMAAKAGAALDVKRGGTDFTSYGDQNQFSQYLRSGDEGLRSEYASKSLSREEDMDGGYAVPEATGAMIVSSLANLSPLRQIANTIEISTDSIEFLQDEGAADAGWVHETAMRPETGTPTFKKKRIRVHEMYASPRATQKLLDDAYIDIESWLIAKVSQEMARMESQAFLYGDGADRPKGIFAYPRGDGAFEAGDGFEEICTGVDGDFDAEEGADVLIEAMNRLPAENLSGACWLLSRSAYAQLRKLKDRNGQYIWQAGLHGDHPGTLFGYPVVISDQMPNLVAGTRSTPIIFGNFKKAYQIVDRNRDRMNILRDEYTHKPFVEFYVTSRVGGDVVDLEALKFITFGKEGEEEDAAAEAAAAV